MLSSLFRTCRVQPIRTQPIFSSSIRRYATEPVRRRPTSTGNTASRPAPASIAPSPRPTNANLNDLRKLRKIELAEKLYNDGTTLLYTAGGRLRAFRIQCYTLAALCFGAIYLNMHFKTTDVKELKRRGLSTYLAGAYVVIAVFLSAAGSWCIHRSRGQIQTIKLVKKLDSVFLEVTATRRIPFLKHRIVVRPYDMLLDSRYSDMVRIPQWMAPRKLDESSPSATTASVIRNTAAAVSRFFFHVFSAARQFFQREGILSVDFALTDAGAKQAQESLSLDAGGEYMTEGDDKVLLFDLTTFKRPDGSTLA